MGDRELIIILKEAEGCGYSLMKKKNHEMCQAG
jgi:hypothetical protein